MRWSDITLQQFQIISTINTNPAYDELDKILHTACILFDITEYEMSQTRVRKATRLIGKTSKLFASAFPDRAYNRIGRYYINYNIEKMRLGQYVELSHFLQQDAIENAHYILASVAYSPFCKNNSNNHEKVSSYLLKQPISKIAGSLGRLINCFNDFNKGYSGLFGLSENDEEIEEDTQADPFNKQWGWIYSATQVAKHERITLDQAFDLPIRQALNDLAFLKDKNEYDKQQLKRHARQID